MSEDPFRSFFYVLVLSCLSPALCLAQEEEPPLSQSAPPEKPGEERVVRSPLDDTHIDGKTWEERSSAFLKYRSESTSKAPLYPKQAASDYVSRLVLKVDTTYALTTLDKALDAVLQKGPSDPFDKHALMHTWLIARDQMTPQITAKLQAYMALWHHKVWRGYGAMNYRLMMDGSGFLAAEQWPKLVDADGLTAAEIQAATKGRLLSYFKDIVHHNFHEYEAPTYYSIDLAAIQMLADFAQDAEVKNEAGLTLDWMLLNLACSWNQGYNTAPAGRAKYWISTNTSPEELDGTAGIAWLYFGGKRSVRPRGMNSAGSVWFACPGTYKPPSILADIAQDRTRPVLFHGTVILGKNEQVRTTIYHTPNFSLASQYELLPAPTGALYKETRRSMLKWVSDKPSSTFCALQENPQRPYKIQENVKNKFGYGESPFGQVMQDKGTLVGIYAVPEKYPFYRLYAPFSESGSIVKRIEKGGWVICHGGSMLFAFRSVTPYKWAKPQQGEDVLMTDGRTGGWVLETAPLTPYAGGGADAELNRFATDLLARTKMTFDESNPAVPCISYLSLTGQNLALTYRPHGTAYTDQCSVNGKPIDYCGFPLLENPWVKQDVNGDLLTLHHGTETVTYNFANWTRSP